MSDDGEEDEAVQDARRFGMDEEQISEIRAALGRSIGMAFRGVWPVNIPAVAAFCAAGSQWRTTLIVAGGAIVTRFLGLDYAGLRVALDALGIAVTPDLFAGLQVMEGAARNALNGEAHA
jgi:hypothetical protein